MKHSEMRESRPCQVALLVCVWGLVETGRMEEQGGAVQLSGGPGVALGGTSPPLGEAGVVHGYIIPPRIDTPPTK